VVDPVYELLPRCPRCAGWLAQTLDPDSYAASYCVNCSFRAMDPTFTLNALKRDVDLQRGDRRWMTRRRIIE
jgi:hypothetical protein